MLGRQELRQLDLEKQVLVAQSGLNRLALQAEIQGLRSAATWVGDTTRATRAWSPLLVLAAPLAGFLLAKGFGRSSLWLTRVTDTARWILPLYRLWKTFAARRREAKQSQ